MAPEGWRPRRSCCSAETWVSVRHGPGRETSEVQTKDEATRPGRLPNEAYRTREYLTEPEIGKVLDALKRNRHGHRDRLMGLLCFRHGLRVSELVDLQWSDVSFEQSELHVRRLKGSQGNNQPLQAEELNGLRKLRRDGPTTNLGTSEHVPTCRWSEYRA